MKWFINEKTKHLEEVDSPLEIEFSRVSGLFVNFFYMYQLAAAWVL